MDFIQWTRICILLFALFRLCHAVKYPVLTIRYNPRGCTANGSSLYCEGHVPRVVPSGICHVTIRNNSFAIINTTFSHGSWRNVQGLDVEEEEQVTNRLTGNMFGNLKRLLTLGLHLPSPFEQPWTISHNAFAGLNKLQRLDLSDSARFSFERLYDIIKNSSNFPLLRELTLKNFNYIGYGTILDLNSTFLDILGQRHIKSLVVDDTKIYRFYVDPYMPLCSSMKTFSARHSELIFLKGTKRNGTCRALTNVDLSGFNFKGPYAAFVQGSIRQRPNIVVNLTANEGIVLFFNFIANVEMLYLEYSNLNFPYLPVHYIIVYKTNGTLNLKHISLKGTVIPIIDIEVQTPLNFHLRSLDLSNCKIRFIGSKTFATTPFRTISNLHLANNSLHLMDSSEFSQMFLHLANLTNLDLSTNRLTTFPPKTLEGNLKLETLDLSQNALKQFYQSAELPRLRHIDLRENRIEYLEVSSRKWFDRIHAKTKDTGFTLDLRNNTFHCTCATLDFFSWMFAQKYVLYTRPTTCSWNGAQIQVSTHKLKELQFQCDRVSYVLKNVGISIGCIVGLIGTAAFSFLVGKRTYRNYISRKRRTQAITNIQNDKFKYSFLAFLSYSPFDEDIVLKQIHPNLLVSLSQITMVRKEYICIGDREFRPGYSIYNEAHRCLNDSAVTLVVISQDYCQNPHCKNELEQIVFAEKTVVLLVIDPVDKLGDVPLVKQLMGSSITIYAKVDRGNTILLDKDLRRLALALLENVE